MVYLRQLRVTHFCDAQLRIDLYVYSYCSYSSCSSWYSIVSSIINWLRTSAYSNPPLDSIFYHQPRLSAKDESTPAKMVEAITATYIIRLRGKLRQNNDFPHSEEEEKEFQLDELPTRFGLKAIICFQKDKWLRLVLPREYFFPKFATLDSRKSTPTRFGLYPQMWPVL